ncbi:hypothetical protein BASA50_010225 [Batrachochytrium salamandrivorans]|uniref:Uncharacterized protein n=1 Tax=Batrachochytrium salamandrivorans TaxID=1357716 RepID=A0ABQ8EZ34_9FUNG|nr:hypothetical protein BASA61_010398 [Batrachochytrium salamandrivorans]KAH6581301.1 hypothetical protein BASA60_002477 [Batrachochytrium salamandrivorans]KAH6589183.1 hypothetical protein BASA50_010225 [Batrachochytrium salamandrivorans]KAJ1342465.1 hypothetical protein BSLG_002964 [Batrachochytrium salamandrivorans]
MKFSALAYVICMIASMVVAESIDRAEDNSVSESLLERRADVGAPIDSETVVQLTRRSPLSKEEKKKKKKEKKEKKKREKKERRRAKKHGKDNKNRKN